MLNLLTFLLLFIQQSEDYRIDLGEYYQRQKQEKVHGYVETFTVLDPLGKHQYLISITKVELPSFESVPDVYGLDYKQALLSRCGCTVTSSGVKQFRHFEAQEFKIIRNGKRACIYTTIKGKKLFSITYSAIGNRNTEEKYPDFEKVINTLELL